MWLPIFFNHLFAEFNCQLVSCIVTDICQFVIRVSAVRCHFLSAQDTEFEPSVMGGAPYQCGRFAGSLRKHLFREHLGQLQGRFLLDDSADVSDPVSRHFYRDVWQHTAARNTQIYEEVRMDRHTAFII